MILQVYRPNLLMAFIDLIIASIFLYLLVRYGNILLPKKQQIPDKINNKCILISILITMGISYAIRFLFEIFGYFNALIESFNNVQFHFAIMISIFIPLHNKFVKSRLNFSKENGFSKNDLFKKVFFIILLISWIVALIYTSIPILNIPLYDIDIFDLGFIWAFILVLIEILLTYIINKIIPIEKRIPNQALKNSMIVGAVISFGIWSLQLIIVELYLSRYFGIIFYEQDIRFLLIIVSIIYCSTFYIFLKRKFLPKTSEISKRKVQEALELAKKFQTKKEISGDTKNVILDVQDLTTYFYTEEGVVKAVEGVNFKIFEGEVLGLVGETGCGKSVTALSILQLVRPPGRIEKGKVLFEEEDLLQKSKEEILDYRGNKITMIFQDPLNSLNPVFKVGDQISEVYLLHMEDELLVETSEYPNKGLYSVAKDWSIELLRELNIPAPERIIDQFPHELSGGMRQRIQIAMGLACGPKLLIADEPTTALDVTVQNQILKLMKNLKKKYNTSILFITHDLGIISKMCDRVAVMYSGFIVEYGKIQKLFSNPYHPYTKGLMKAVPVVGKKRKRLKIIPGIVPNLIYPPSGCRYHPRCKFCFEPCDKIIPKPIEVEPNYYVACHFYEPEYKKLAQRKKREIREKNS